MDTDYLPPYYAQKKILHKNPSLSQQAVRHQKKEEATRHNMEIKVNRYPLRQYKNLGAGIDVHSRPNYYESDQEEEDCRKRRHSISSLAHEGEGVNRPNLKIGRQRRYSEGTTLWERRRAIEDNDVEEADSNLRNDGLDNDESDSDREDLCITQTLTYTSKKQVIKVYKTEHLDVNKQQSKAVFKRLCDLASEDGQPKNGLSNCKNKKDGLSEKQPIHLNSTDLLSSVQLDDQDDIEKEMENIHGHPQEEENNTVSKSYFLAQLKLKSLHCRDLDENAGKGASENEGIGEESSVLPSEVRVPEMKDKVTQTEDCFKKITSSSDKPRKYIKKDKLYESKTPPKSSGEKLSPHSKSLKKDKKKKFPSKTHRAKDISSKAKLIKDSCKNLELHNNRSKPNVDKTLNGRSDGSRKETTRLSEKKPSEYHEVLKMACENTLKPDTAVNKKTVSTSTSNESRNRLTKENKQCSGCSGFKKVSKTETVDKEKRRSKVTKEDQQSAGCSGFEKMNKTETVSKEKMRSKVTKEDQQSAGCSGLGKMNKTETVSKEKMRSKVTKEDQQSAGCSGLGKMNKTKTVSKEKTRNSVTKEDEQSAGCSGLGKMNKTETGGKEKRRSKLAKEDQQCAGCSGLGKMNKTETVSKEKTRNSVTKEHDQSAGCSGFEKVNKTETANKEKTTSVEKTKKSEATKDLLSSEDKENTTKATVQNIQPPCNREDLESKLHRLFEEPDQQNLGGGSSIETIPMKTARQNQNDSTNKPKTIYLNQNDSTNKPKTTHLNQTNSTNKPKTTCLNQNDSTNKPKTTHLNQNDSTNKPTTIYFNQNVSTNKPKTTNLNQNDSTNKPKTIYFNQNDSTNKPKTTNLNQNDSTNKPKTIYFNQNDSTNKPKTTNLNQNDSTNKPKTTHLNQTNSTNKPKTTCLNQNDSTNKPKTTHLNQNDSTNKPTTIYFNQNDSTNKPKTTNLNQNDSTNKPKTTHLNQTNSTNKPKTTNLNQNDSTNKPKTIHLNQTNSTNKPKSSHLIQNNSTNKPSQHHNLHKVKDKINKTTKRPTKPKARRYSDKPTSSQGSSTAEMGASITMEMVKQLHEKGRVLFKTKPTLEKILWPDRQGETTSTLNSTEQKAEECKSVPEDKQNIKEPSKENVMEKGNDQCGETSNTTAVDSKEAESNELLGEELLANTETQIEFEEIVAVSPDSNERDSESIEIVERCCCCSPIAIPEVLPNENSNSDNHNLHSNTQELDIPLKMPEESGKSDSNVNNKNGGTCTGTSLEDILQDESEEDKDRRRLIAALTDSVDIPLNPLNYQEVETESESIAKNSNTKKPASDVQVNAAGMEHYKKRLIHQHEKPGAQISPYATAEEDDDSWESPLSPASSNVSRDSGQQDRRKEDVVQKVARKRAVCRSQFRHQNMELFKLGHSIPTSLCKTKEPYNVCAEKNLQMCYQNGGSKKCDKNPARGSLTESIINTMEGSKKKDIPLWRSVSLNNELERQIAPLNNNEGDSKNSGSGRHVLPAIVPELPERRKNRIKSLPESSVRSTRDNAEAENSKSSNEGYPRGVYDFAEGNEEVAAARNKPVEAISKQSVVRQKSREESGEPQAQDIVEAHSRNSDSTSMIRRQSTSSESDVLDCVPINLSMKNKDANGPQPTWSDVFSTHHAKRNESNYNQHLLAYSIPKQPSNVPKKPPHPPEEIVPRNRLEENLARTISENLDAGHLDKDGNCVFVTSIPGNALDPQKQSNVIVINFPYLQQQMARMEKPGVALAAVPEPQHSQMEMLESAITSLVNIVKSSVESDFNILSLPVLNRLYMDLSRYLLLPAVSIKMKLCIDEALNQIVSYVLVNMFRRTINSKLWDFVHKMMQLDLRPHMDFIVDSLHVICQKIMDDYYTEHLLKMFSRNPNENFQPLPPQRNASRPVADHPNVRALMPPPPQQVFPGHSQPAEFRNCYSRPWTDNPPYQHGNPIMPNVDLMGGVAKSQPQKRGRRQHQEADRNLLASMRVPENFHEPNLAMMRPDLYLADNRCIPPNIGHMHPEALTNQARAPKGRPRILNKPNKLPNKLPENTLDLSLLSQRAMLEQNQRFSYREKSTGNVPNSNVLASQKPMHRNGDIAPHREMMEENLQFRNRSRLIEERRLSEAPLVPNMTRNGGNFFNGNHPLPMIKNYEIRNDSDRRNNAGIFSKDRLMQTLATVINDGNNVKITHNTTPMNEIQRYPRPEPKNVSRNNPELPSGARQAIILSNEIVHHKKQIEPNAKVTTKNTQDDRVAVAKQCPVSDVEQFLQTNIIVNKHQPASASVVRGSVLENVTPTKNINNQNEVEVCEGKGDQRIIEKVVNEYRFDKDSVQLNTGAEKTNALPTEVANSGTNSNTVESNVCYNKEREESGHFQSQEVIEANDSPEVVSSTVIIKDKSMEISKGDTSLSENVGVPGVVNNQMDLDDVILERVSLNGELRNGISYTSGWSEGTKPSGRPKEIEKRIGRESSKERLRIVADVSIEKVTDNFDAPPKLIKLTTLKRKVVQEDKQQRKRVKRWPVQGEINDEIVIIEDDDKGREQLDYNQNNVGEGDKSKEVSEDSREKSATASEPQADVAGKNDTSKTPKQAKAKSSRPLIEDISSDEEVLAPFRLYSTYENKVNGDPRKILQTTEVSEITLIDDNVAVIENANRHLFEKPPVYTRPVMPRKLRKSLADDPGSWNEPLAKMVQFSEDSSGLTCSLKVKNSELKYPSNIDVRRYSPVVSYQHPSPTRSPRFSPTFKSPPRPIHASPGVIQTSPGVRRSPTVPMSPTVSGSPKAQTVTRLPIGQTSPVVVQTSPVVVQTSPIGLTPPHLNESDVNWRHWFAEEERNGVFNFERSQSLESNTLSGQSVEASNSVGSDYSPKFPSEEPLYEIKIDSKPYKITKSMLEKIPRGKLCYVRETNTFIRYFDDKQMELFINNLNLGEGSTVASDLLKQVRGRAEGPTDVETPPVQSDKSEKGEVITLSKDVVFSMLDYLADAELYVEEVEKVQRYVPKDFYGFYKFVTGYQIIHHNSPISFQTFLTMHNTNSIRGLFKKYVNAVVEGRNIL